MSTAERKTLEVSCHVVATIDKATGELVGLSLCAGGAAPSDWSAPVYDGEHYQWMAIDDATEHYPQAADAIIGCDARLEELIVVES